MYMVTFLISAGKCAYYLLIKKEKKEVCSHFNLLLFLSSLILIFLLSEWISVVAFLRVQWEPFETQFGKVSSSFRYHLGVLNHSVQALQYNAIQDGNRIAEIERQRIQHKESGMICSNSSAA